ncbi:MAG: putative Fibronectin, type precursor [Acidobacteria bacterium]|nr:putative Fibronectin, type precursor [Acidobacteriota bacterium]
MRSALRKWIAVGALAALAACGKRGDPKPPVPVIPQATSDLVVTQRGPKVILSWAYPSLTAAGKSLPAFRRVVVYRYVEELPVPQGGRDPNTILPGDVDPTIPPQVPLFAKIPPLGPTQFAKLKERVDSIESANLPAATTGSRLTYEDTPAFRSTDGRPVRLTYSVVTEGAEAHSDISNLAVIVPIDVPVAPADLKAEAKPQGVVLTWTKPAATITGTGKPYITGYNVYRAVTGSPDELGTAVNTSPASAPTYTDVPPYGTYSYRVTAVATTGNPRIESDPSNSATATFKDLLPPPAPASVTALVETKAVRLVWDPVEAPDLLGYNVYRTEGTGRIKLTPGPATITYFRDISADPGIGYYYSVTAVDKSGNESQPTRTTDVLVPKTP